MPEIPISRQEFILTVSVPGNGNATFPSLWSLLSGAQQALVDKWQPVDGYIVAPATDAVQRRDDGSAAAIAARANDYHEIPIGVSWPMPNGFWLRNTYVRMKGAGAVNVTLVVYCL